MWRVLHAHNRMTLHMPHLWGICRLCLRTIFCVHFICFWDWLPGLTFTFLISYIVITIIMIGSLCCPVDLCAVPGALPLVINDCVHSDEDDTLWYVLTGCLCKSFEFNVIVEWCHSTSWWCISIWWSHHCQCPCMSLSRAFPVLNEKETYTVGLRSLCELCEWCEKRGILSLIAWALLLCNSHTYTLRVQTTVPCPFGLIQTHLSIIWGAWAA